MRTYGIERTGKRSEQVQIPELYLAKMENLLGAEYPNFRESLDKPPVAGLRVNTLKVAPQEILKTFPDQLAPVSWCPAGFRLNLAGAHPGTGVSLGRHPYHAAGLYYLQEPSAMAPAEILDPQPDERVLDLAAAPGGKTTHILAKMGNRGLLIANEVHPQRVWELAENLERWGARNVILLNETPPHLAEHFEGFFDRVLLDAPCSGEGMFRKSESARRDWSPQLVESCATRQSAILNNAARMLRPGGILVYSTCTFSPEENEGVVGAFLADHPDFELEQVESSPGFNPGRPEWGGGRPELAVTVRIWSHKADADGHFIARMRKKGKPGKPSFKPSRPSPPSAQVMLAFREFSRQALSQDVDFEPMHLSGPYLYHLPPDSPDLQPLRVIHPGLWLGRLKPGKRSGVPRFEPAHALALSLRPSEAQQTINLDGEQAMRYLRGETLSAPGEEGWVLVTINNYPLGWGRRVGGILKNYYPKGLRRG